MRFSCSKTDLLGVANSGARLMEIQVAEWSYARRYRVLYIRKRIHDRVFSIYFD